MKTHNYFLATIIVCSYVMMTSCKKEEQVEEEECHECHIAFVNDEGNEVEVDIGEFCGTALETVESPDYTHTLDEDQIVGNDTVPAGDYNDIHCEEHANHDH